MLKDMMKKKDEKVVDPAQGDAKLNALKDLRKMASEMMGEDLKNGMGKKVVVEAKDKEGLKKGLDMAKEVVSSNPEEIEMPDAEMNDLGGDMAAVEDSEEQQEVRDNMEEECSPEELDAKIAALQEQKKKLMAKK